MEGGGQQVERGADAFRGDDEIQPPAKELPLLRRAIAAVFRAAHLTEAPGPRPSTDWHGHAVEDEDRAPRERFAQAVEQHREPVGEAMQPTVEARDGERAGEIARPT